MLLVGGKLPGESHAWNTALVSSSGSGFGGHHTDKVTKQVAACAVTKGRTFRTVVSGLCEAHFALEAKVKQLSTRGFLSATGRRNSLAIPSLPLSCDTPELLES